MKDVDALIFDLDGTLWEPTEMCLNAWNMVLQNKSEMNLITKEALNSVFGMKFDLIGAKLFPHLDDKERDQLMIACMRAEEAYIRKHGATLYPNLEKVLKILSKSYPLAIVSNCQSGYIEAFLDYYQLHDYFCDIECAGNTACDKGENIKLVMQRNQFKKPIYIGDTEGDYTAALFCNIPFIFAKYGFGSVENAKTSIAELTDLLTLF